MKTKNKALMIQGTGSHVGKSVIVAGLCRYFYNKGYKVCPFKTQNMALNSFVTSEGKEMGRAQVVQAEAAGLKPDVSMNPILIKPVSDCKAQVIFMGKVVDNMSAVQYDSNKKYYLDKISKIFTSLQEEFDLVIIEGAGSPAEINLLKNDIVNMRTAEFARSPVVLVGDIDKGGVFASFYGTTKILPRRYQKYIKGYLVNKFRGDKSLLKPGLKWLESKLKRQVLGVIPYFNDIKIEEEDSVNLEKKREELLIKKDRPGLKIGVIYLQHISNFTDFNALELDPRVTVQYLKYARELEEFNPDLVILPGSKSTISDLQTIRSSGIEDIIKKLVKKGVSVAGICGGYQMLGKVLLDPDAVESDVSSLNGLGLIDINTVFLKNKKTIQSEFRLTKSAKTILGIKEDPIMKGYEIHMGRSSIPDDYARLFSISADEDDGVIIDDKGKGFILGTYIHGIFDDKLFREAIISKLYKNKYKGSETDLGLSGDVVSYGSFKESQYDKLAKLFEDNMDMDKLLKIIENGV